MARCVRAATTVRALPVAGACARALPYFYLQVSLISRRFGKTRSRPLFRVRINPA